MTQVVCGTLGLYELSSSESFAVTEAILGHLWSPNLYRRPGWMELKHRAHMSCERNFCIGVSVDTG